MDYSKQLRYHYRPSKGWINDPNGLVYYQGYYHVFYQHCPDFEIPWQQPMHWGHARTKDFLHWEELPIALTPGDSYDRGGCWSGTALVKDDMLFLLYTSVGETNQDQTVSMAYSTDGIHFEKYERNPVIREYPAEGSADFRDPALCFIDGAYYCVMASGNPEDQAARLLLYKSANMVTWTYLGVMAQWENSRYAECPSLIQTEEGVTVSTSVLPVDRRHYFSIMYGQFKDGKFTAQYTGSVDKGPDQYAGQLFKDHLGRSILISWLPGWKYRGYVQRDIGCMSVPKEIKLENGVIYGYPVKELQHLLTDQDPCVKRTETGFVVERENREPLVYEGDITDLKILRDEYLVEIFVNGGREIYTVLL